MSTHILVVDDEPDVESMFRQHFRRDLRSGRFIMEFALSAPAALERSGTVDLAALADNTIALYGGGLGRQLNVYRLPESDWSQRVALDHMVSFEGGADLPVYLRVTQADGHQAWSSPIYLIE